jgi:hypothetical protein
MITVNVFSRVFFIKTPSNLGTAFTIEVDSRQYLVTARHVVEGLCAPVEIQVSHDNQWKSLRVERLWIHAAKDIDVAVLPMPLQLSRTLPCPPTIEGLVWGQETFFLGYPFGLTGERTEHNGGFPIAFVRGATFSAGLRDSEGLMLLMLDGHCNEGFSGGPIVFRPRGSQRSNDQLAIAGVVAGFESVPSPVQIKSGETQMSVLTNAGLVRGHAIDHAIAGARALACGFEVVPEA